MDQATATVNRTGTPALDAEQSSVELSARRTGMSFQRTRLSADRTLMSVIRTALSLISFGFTIAKVFQHMVATHVLSNSVAPRRFGAALGLLGVAMLLFGVMYHVFFMRGLRTERLRMKEAGLVHAESIFPTSLTLIVAVLLLGLGVLASFSILFDLGPFD